MKKRVIVIALIAIETILISVFPLFDASAVKISAYLRGDANGDGYVTISDVTAIQQIVAGIAQDQDGYAALSCDVNSDGVLDINDAVLIQKYLARFDMGSYGINTVVTVPEETAPPTTSPRDNYELPFIPD